MKVENSALRPAAFSPKEIFLVFISFGGRKMYGGKAHIDLDAGATGGDNFLWISGIYHPTGRFDLLSCIGPSKGRRRYYGSSPT